MYQLINSAPKKVLEILTYPVIKLQEHGLDALKTVRLISRDNYFQRSCRTAKRVFLQILIIFGLFLFVSCEDDDQLFSPPANIVTDIQYQIDYFRLMNGLPVLNKSEFIANVAKIHATYLWENDTVNHDGQQARCDEITTELGLNSCNEIVEFSQLHGTELMEDWQDDPQKLNMLMKNTYIGIGVEKKDPNKYIVIILAR
jgi:hypothetical protein